MEPRKTDPTGVAIRSLTADDLAAVVALDRKITGTSRRDYFEKRLAAAIRHPSRHLQLAATGPSGMIGFLLARTALGEYGRVGTAGVLETVGVDPGAQGTGIGRAMMAGLEDRLRARDVGSIVTQADWRNYGMLRFLHGAGFSLADEALVHRELGRRLASPNVLAAALAARLAASRGGADLARRIVSGARPVAFGC